MRERTVRNAIKQVAGQLAISSLLCGISLVCFGAVWHLAAFAINAPNSAVAEFAMGAALLLACIGVFCGYWSIALWSMK